MPLDPTQLLRDLVALPGPPGQEDAVRAYVEARVRALGRTPRTDAKGNLLVGPETARVVVTAHLDEIALMVKRIDASGAIFVLPLGGAFAWKWGEGPVDLLARPGSPPVPGVLSFGSIHTTAPGTVIQSARDGVVPTWNDVRVRTGLSAEALAAAGVRVGTRVVVAASRRTPIALGGDLVASFFLDDRADLVAWLLALEATPPERSDDILWAATVSEEVGGEGVSYLLQGIRPEVCVALEIGPRTPDADFPLDADPTCWVTDSYATTDPRDLDLLEAATESAGIGLHLQAVTRGGSDASCAASRGLCARPVTLAFAAENSHGFEIMHRDAPARLARLTNAYLDRFLSA